MKRAGTGAVVALLLGCTAMVGAQSGSGTGATDRSGSTQGTTPGQGSPQGTGGTSGQGGSTTRGTSGATTPAAPQTRANQAARPQELTLTGCLMSDQAAVGTTGSATGAAGTAAGTSRPGQTGTAAPMPTFTLSTAAGSSGGSSAAGATGTSGGSYKLQGSALEGHVGQQVEIKGTLVPQERTRTSSRSSTSAPAGTSDTAQQTVRVTSVRMISPMCGSTSGSGTGGNSPGAGGGNR